MQWTIYNFIIVGCREKTWLTDDMDSVDIYTQEDTQEEDDAGTLAHEDTSPEAVGLKKIVTNIELIVKKSEMRIRLNNLILTQKVKSLRHLEMYFLALILLVLITT